MPPAKNWEPTKEVPVAIPDVFACFCHVLPCIRKETGFIRPDVLASAANEASFSPGARVRVVGLEKQQTLNSATGTLVKLHNDRWQVRLDGEGDKLLKAKNLILEDAQGHPNKENQHVHRPSMEEPRRGSFSRPSPEYVRADSMAIDIAGSWNGWRPQRMAIEPQRRCHKFQVQLPSSSSESFQLFVPGDGLGRCIHPDRADATPHEFHRLVGPDDNGKGYSWTIGKHSNDKAAAGGRYEVILIYAANGKPDRVDWVHLNPRSAVQPKPSFPARPSVGSASKQYAGMTMAAFLQAAKPEWSAKEVTSVCEKLSKIAVVDLPSLLRVVQSDGSSGINHKFKSAGEKAFTDQTLRALRQHAKKVSEEESVRIERAKTSNAPKPERAAPSPQSSASLPPLPTQEYRVVHEFAYVRQDPSLHSPLCGKKDQGETVRACEETFDGWIKLHGQPGYIIKDMGGKQGIGKILAAVGKAQPLVLPEPQAAATPLVFEVVYKPLVAVRTGPSKSRPIQACSEGHHNCHVHGIQRAAAFCLDHVLIPDRAPASLVSASVLTLKARSLSLPTEYPRSCSHGSKVEAPCAKGICAQLDLLQTCSVSA